MREPSVHVNIHAYDEDTQFNPAVSHFQSGREIISLMLETTSVFLNRDRLHQLKDVLVAACEKYPVQEPCPDCGGKLFHSDTCFLAKDQEDRRVEA